MQEQVDYTQFPIRGEFATMENEEGEKNILFFFRNITVELTQEYILIQPCKELGYIPGIMT